MLRDLDVANVEFRTDHAEGATSRRRRLVDLFAGCGGLSLGFEQAGFTPIFVNELNDDARSTYLANRPHAVGGLPFNAQEELWSSDVHDLTSGRLSEIESYLRSIGESVFFGEGGNVDVLAGGPPCQGYSGIGHRRSYSVDKVELPSNQLYARMAEVIEHVRPRIFLFENVKGLLSSRWTADGKRGEIWKDVYGRFRKLGDEFDYVVRWKLVHAKDYGVPQNRPRVLIVGVRGDVAMKAAALVRPEVDEHDAVLCGLLPPHGETAPDLEDALGDLIDATTATRLRNRDLDGDFATKVYLRPAATKWQKYFRPGELARAMADLTEQEYSKHSAAVVKKFDAMLKNGGVIPDRFRTKKFAQRVLPPTWGNAGPSITACSLADDYVHFAQPRSLTVREWARLQTFPDSYVFKGKRTTGGLRRAGNPREGIFDREVPKYTQIGNAVPVKLAEAIGQHFEQLLNKAGL